MVVGQNSSKNFPSVLPKIFNGSCIPANLFPRTNKKCSQKKVKAITNFYLLVSAPQSQKVWKPLQRIIKGQKKKQQ